MRKVIDITIESRDAGGTQEVAVFIAGKPVANWTPGTGHEDYACAETEQVIGRVLGKLIQDGLDAAS